MSLFMSKNSEGTEKCSSSTDLEQQHSESPAVQFVDNRAVATAQHLLADSINSSPKQVAQRQQFSAQFGDVAQLQAEEKALQMKAISGVVQRAGPEDEVLLQGMFSSQPVQRKSEAESNKTGLPDNLKSGVEKLSGYSMDDVKVHYNSDKPSQLQAHAYAQGTDIHVASGQEKHLPHEAWHVVQQKQGRVRPTVQMKSGVPVNDDAGLEREADVMGEKSLSLSIQKKATRIARQSDHTQKMDPGRFDKRTPVQRMVGINSGSITSEINSLISNPDNIPKMTEAYTYLQHIDWAHNIVGGTIFDMTSPKFNNISSSENLILVAHGLEGVSGKYDGTAIANFLADPVSGVPDGWEGSVFITSCYSGAGADSVVKAVAARLETCGKAGINVTGYTGTTITHKQFEQFLFVVNPAKETEMKVISDKVARKYAHLFAAWYVKMQGLNADNILEMAAYTSALTATAYAEIVQEASESDIFMDESDAEVTHTS